MVWWGLKHVGVGLGEDPPWREMEGVLEGCDAKDVVLLIRRA